MPNESKMRHNVGSPEDLHNIGKNSYQKAQSEFVNPGIGGAMISKADLEDPVVSKSASEGLQNFLTGGQSMNREENY
jgi:hypothetical protein